MKSKLDRTSRKAEFPHMPNDDQVQTDATETTAADSTGFAESTQSGTNDVFESFNQEVQAALAGVPDTDDQPQPDSVQPAEEEEEETPAAEEESEPEEETEPEDPGVEPEQPEGKSSKRVRFSDPADIAVAALAKAKGITLVEAAKIYEGSNPTAAQPSSAQESQSNDSSAEAETVQSVEARIAQLEEEAASAVSSLEFEVAEERRKEANSLRNKLMDLKIAEVLSKKDAEKKSEAQFMADYAKSEDKAISFYPDAANPNSQLHKRMMEIEQEMLRLQDPLYFSSDKPWILAQSAAAELKIRMRDLNKDPVKASLKTRPTIQPAGGDARTTTTNPTKRAAEVIDGLASSDDFEALVASALR